MYASEIRTLMSKFPFTRQSFLGVYARDQVSSIDFTPLTFAVVNLDPHYMRGSHWTAIVCYETRCLEFFDSLGSDQSMLFELSAISDHLVWNSAALQRRDSTTCAAFVCFFLVQRCENWDLDFYEILKEFFYASPDLNETLVTSYFNSELAQM